MKTSDILSKQQLMEFGVLFGPPPVLTTEETQHYEEVWRSLIESLKPRDFLELLLIKQVQTETWKILRYTRHQSVGIERRFRQSLRFQFSEERSKRHDEKCSLESSLKKLEGQSPTLSV